MNLKSFSLILWNATGRVKNTSEQLNAFLEFSPDIIAIPEIRTGSLITWKKDLARSGYNISDTTGITVRKGIIKRAF